MIVAVLAAAVAAVLYTLASPPWDRAPLAWLAPALLLLPVARLRGLRAALPGLVFGICIAVGITSWAAHAVLEYFALDRLAAFAFASLVWLIHGGAPYAVLTMVYAALARRAPQSLHPALAAWLWVAVEVLRSRTPLGLPWGLLSHTQWRSLTLIQVADLAGAFGVTFVVVFVSVSLALAVREMTSGRARLRRAALHALAAAGVLTLALGYGRAARSEAPGDERWGRVAVVQGNVPNAFRWQRAFFERTLASYLRLTSALDAAPPAMDLVVWPENAVNFYLEREPTLLGRLREMAVHNGAALLVGAPRLAASGDAHNSAYLIGADGALRATYDKRLLVPFAEGSILPVSAAVADEGARYVGGERVAPLATRDLSLGVLICFEVLFPDLVRDTIRDGANLLVNISNDSWMDAGDGAAPRQHFAAAVLRAVEVRRALVRASSGGVSGFVAPTGEVYDTVPWGTSGAAVGGVALRNGATPYAYFGDAWVAVLGGALLLAILVARREAFA